MVRGTTVRNKRRKSPTAGERSTANRSMDLKLSRNRLHFFSFSVLLIGSFWFGSIYLFVFGIVQFVFSGKTLEELEVGGGLMGRARCSCLCLRVCVLVCVRGRGRNRGAIFDSNICFHRLNRRDLIKNSRVKG